ncbi:mevalonate kinase-like [Pogonomyrmex barbatus]|uniref:Mevalonate kinase-like n=1 Tax=Pogonomyrmex barbatus TaxID=144034 RepID=A0A6I9X1S9_9HYME|nr:mevalonate kinase-like [Pogonomyrmex barbatus]
MHKFKISAPGTVFLYGDPKLEIDGHNNRCIAAGLDIRTKLEFSSPFPTVVPEKIIRIEFINLKLYLEIPLKAIYECFYDRSGVREFSSEHLMNGIKEFTKSLNIRDSICETTKEAQNLFLQSFLYLLLNVAYEEDMKLTTSILVKLSTDLPIAKGLGSTTSFIVCLAACFWRWSLLQKGIVRYTFDSQDCTKIRRHVWRCEKIVYNFKNTINNFISIYGAMVMYKDEIDMFTLDKMQPIKILIVDSNINQEITIEQLQQNMEHLDRYVDSIITRAALDKSFEAIEIFQKLRKEDQKRNNTNGLLSKILDFINMNQDVLNAGGLSNHNIEFICAIAQKYSVGCKMIGTGGYVLIFALAHVMDYEILLLKNELEFYNYHVIKTTMFCNGVRIE